MTKKDYELIASVLYLSKQWNKNFATDTYQIVCENFANTLGRLNPLFDRTKFLKACGFESEANNE